MSCSKPVTLSVTREGEVRVLKLHSVGKKPYEVMEVIVRLSKEDRVWLRETLK